MGFRNQGLRCGHAPQQHVSHCSAEQRECSSPLQARPRTREPLTKPLWETGLQEWNKGPGQLDKLKNGQVGHFPFMHVSTLT